MSLRNLCSQLGGVFKQRRYDNEEFEVCIIKIEEISPYQKRLKVHEILSKISEFAQNELGLNNLSLGSTLHFTKASQGYTARAEASLTVDRPENVKAIEIEFDPKEKRYFVTPITKRGRGCYMFFSKYGIGVECSKNGTTVSSEGSIFY